MTRIIDILKETELLAPRMRNADFGRIEFDKNKPAFERERLHFDAAEKKNYR